MYHLQLLLAGCLLPPVIGALPNFLVLFPDQWRFDFTPENPLLGESLLPMPTYTSLLQEGTLFKHAFVPSPLCAPSRACLAGGREYDEAGVPDNFSNDYPLNATTFYTLLRKAGYSVATTGKDDLTKSTGPGLNGSFHASALGFSQWARCDGKQDAAGAQPHDPYGAWCAANSEVVKGKNMSYWEIYNNDMGSCAKPKGASSGYDCESPSPLPQSAYEDNWVAQNAVGLLVSKPPNTPWFLQVSFPGPHPPFVVTAPMMNTTQGSTFPLAADNPTLPPAIQQTVRRDYAAELINLDALFALVIAAIPREEMGNTYIIVSSDHGEMLGDHGDWGKTLPWQGSVSVPLVVLGPGLPRNASYLEPVGTMDIAGTVLDFAGLTPDITNGMTTRSLRPLLSSTPNPAAYRPFVSSGLGSWRAVVQTRPDGLRLKLVCCKGGACPGQPGNATRGGGWVGEDGEGEGRYPQELLMVRGGGRGEGHQKQQEEGKQPPPDVPPPTGGAAFTHLLFDVDADPFDMMDLAPSKPTALKDMIQLLPLGWCGSNGPSLL